MDRLYNTMALFRHYLDFCNNSFEILGTGDGAEVHGDSLLTNAENKKLVIESVKRIDW